MGNKSVNFAQQRRLAKKAKNNKLFANHVALVESQVLSESMVLEVKSPEMVVAESHEAPLTPFDRFIAGLNKAVEAANEEHDKVSTSRFKLGAEVVEKPKRFATPPSGWSK